MAIYLPTVRYAATLQNGIVTCKQGSKEIKSAIVADEDISGLFGGGDSATIQLPLWQYLDSKEKKAIRFAVKLYQKGDMAELQARYNDMNLNRIVNAIISNAMLTQHEKRTTRKGLIRYGTFGNPRSTKSGFALIESNQVQT